MLHKITSHALQNFNRSPRAQTSSGSWFQRAGEATEKALVLVQDELAIRGLDKCSRRRPHDKDPIFHYCMKLSCSKWFNKQETHKDFLGRHLIFPMSLFPVFPESPHSISPIPASFHPPANLLFVPLQLCLLFPQSDPTWEHYGQVVHHQPLARPSCALLGPAARWTCGGHLTFSCIPSSPYYPLSPVRPHSLTFSCFLLSFPPMTLSFICPQASVIFTIYLCHLYPISKQLAKFLSPLFSPNTTLWGNLGLERMTAQKSTSDIPGQTGVSRSWSKTLTTTAHWLLWDDCYE